MSDKPIVFNYKDYVRIREQLKQYEWIPIEDRLPEVGRDGYSDYILLSLWIRTAAEHFTTVTTTGR